MAYIAGVFLNLSTAFDKAEPHLEISFDNILQLPVIATKWKISAVSLFSESNFMKGSFSSNYTHYSCERRIA